MATPSVERRRRIREIETPRRRAPVITLLTGFIGAMAWTIIGFSFAPEAAVGLSVAAGAFAVVCAIAARVVEANRGRDSVVWQVLAGFAFSFIACILMAGFGTSLFPILWFTAVAVLVVKIIGKSPAERSAVAEAGEPERLEWL